MLSLSERNDSWQNLLTGLGTARDKAVYSHYAPETALPLEYLEQLYLNDDLASRIVDLVPNEMLRQGFLINKESPSEEIKLSHHLSDALIKARLFGAAFIYLGIEDGLEQHKPVVEGKIKRLKFINVISAKDICIKNHYQMTI